MAFFGRAGLSAGHWDLLRCAVRRAPPHVTKEIIRMTKSTSYGTARPSGGAQRAGMRPDRAAAARPGGGRAGADPGRRAGHPGGPYGAQNRGRRPDQLGRACLAGHRGADIARFGRGSEPHPRVGDSHRARCFRPRYAVQRLHRGPAGPGRPVGSSGPLRRAGSGGAWAYRTACGGHPQPAAISQTSRRGRRGRQRPSAMGRAERVALVPRSARLPPVPTSLSAASRGCVNGAAAGQRRYQRYEWRLVRDSAPSRRYPHHRPARPARWWPGHVRAVARSAGRIPLFPAP